MYVLNNTDKCVKILETAWEMEEAEGNIERSHRTRIDILHKAMSKECEDPSCQWMNMAKDTLTKNGIDIGDFAQSVRDTLIKGRGKGRNIIIIGTANCGKTFMLAPLLKIFKAFVNPASGSFAWVGIENAEIIYLNDFRWNDKIIQWQDFLRLLEGDAVHFPAPKTHYAQDILLTADTPIFATSIRAITRYQNASMAQGETEMVRVRWKVFQFYHQIAIDVMVDSTPCESSFVKLVMEY